MPDLRSKIQIALNAFEQKPLKESALSLLAVLGYKSDRTLNLGSSKPKAFVEFLNANSGGSQINETKALVCDWKSADLLFQLTDNELSGQRALFDEHEVSPSLLKSYVFFAIELTGDNYARGKLTDIARQINRVFPMPVMVLIKHKANKSPTLSIAVINRRANKRDTSKDVLGKVTIIRDVAFSETHRGHLDILDSFAIENLNHPQRLLINNFDNLHTAWEQVFNVELLNKRFYKELANWYFWALPQVQFPEDVSEDDEKRRATSLIRLLTRLIFCWFLKEKGLVPESLFNETDLKSILNELKSDSSSYYHAILQNLFFGTLNQRMGKDSKGNPYRAFAKDEGFHKNKNTYGVDNLFRYEDCFKDPDAALELFADIPFLNGGLFECLDRTDPKTEKKIYIDGFSRNKKKRPTVPNHLFFSDEQSGIDLSSAYGERSRRNEKVRGLIRILSSYKFTIVENTPIDQEIALDPELLGKVFENLLASYNEETKTTARKQTGSFYTPRPIVEYMVDESLKAYLTTALTESGMAEDTAKSGLETLFAYTEEPHPFTNRQVDKLLEAIHTCKVLDPACGSGAFPMGMLQKLVYIIHKLDPANEKWQQLQIDKASEIPDSSARDAAIKAIEQDFADNEDDYGRKLYLIENCLYGVDIQPIAIQISKLRFFISLVCDQKTNRSKRDNLGIRPLPNLETKFVAADTLIELPEMKQLVIAPERVFRIEKEIEGLYHRHFSIQRRDQKLSLQKTVRDKRIELGKLLSESLMAPRKAQHIADWDPFDHEAVADFFDPHWMFGPSVSKGFDIIIGNPPYQSAIDHKKVKGEEYRNKIKSIYDSASGTWDLYIPFFEAGLRCLKPSSVISYITPNKYLSASYAKALRQVLPKKCRLVRLTDVSHLPVFESASVYPVITVLEKSPPTSNYPITLYLPDNRHSAFDIGGYKTSSLSSKNLTLLPDNLWGFLLSPNVEVLQRLLTDCKALDEFATVRATTTAAEADAYGAVITSSPCNGWKTLNTGTIDPFVSHWDSRPIKHQGRSIAHPMLARSTVSRQRADLYDTPKILIAKMALSFEGFLDVNGEFAALNCNCVSRPRHGWTLPGLLGLLHSSTVAFAYKQLFDGLKMSGGYLPFQAPQLRCIPVPQPHFDNARLLGRLVEIRLSSFQLTTTNFLWDLIDACVMECYFREHMAERDLLFLDDLAPHLAEYDSTACDARHTDFLEHLYSTLNAPESPIRNRLLRLTADSPDLLAVIKAEGKV
jgi:hypothetical protein